MGRINCTANLDSPRGRPKQRCVHHFALSTISTRRQRLSLDSGRHSMMRTVSPVFASFVSSCALNFTDLRTILPYTGCGTRVSETTTIVLSILSETTRPCLTRRLCRFSCLSCSILSLGDPFFGDDGLNLRVGAAHRAHFAEVGQMTGAQRKAKVEELFLRLFGFLLQLGDRQIAQLFEVMRSHACAASSREMILVAIGSFEAASSSARFPTSRSTPESSNRMRPGRTTATQNSGLPLPAPMRTSAGFLVTDLSGKTLIHTLPPRLM